MKQIRYWRLLLAVGAVVMGGAACAQEFPMFQGSPQRVGSHDADKRANNPSRSFLRWWDPLFELSRIVDNWENSFVTRTPPASWVVPADIEEPISYESNPGAIPRNPALHYSRLTPSARNGNFWQPEVPANLTTFSWRFNNVNPGEEYALSVYVPVGPTDTDPSTALSFVFNATQQVYRIDGVINLDNPGQPVYELVSSLQFGGGFVPLGNGGAATDRVYTVAPGASEIVISLLNVVPRNSEGDLLDDPNGPFVVYADAAQIARPVSGAGEIIASPVVGRLKVGTDPFPWRVYSARLEPFTAVGGNSAADFSFPVLSSFTHNSALVVPGDDTGRRGLVWSWPALRPQDLSTAEQIRYASDRQAWLNGTGTYPGPSRFNQNLVYDNLNGNVQASAGFTSDNIVPNMHGEDYLLTGASPAVTENVTFRPQLSAGTYTIDAWIPQSATWAEDVLYEITIGGVTAQAFVDQNTANGWTRLVAGTQSGFTIPPGGSISVRVTNRGTGGLIVADALRFNRTADLAISSTPVFATVDIALSGGGTAQRDVVVVALENGRIYCLDAKGVQTAGTFTGDTTVYWSYPSEISPDPNQADGLDGVDGIAEMPTDFDLSSAVVERVQVGPGTFEDRLYIGSQNGRVYCLDMSGRGDYSGGRAGTTERIWTYPNDYPTISAASALGPIEGSVSYAVTAQGPTLFVPSTQGRVYALDAVGNRTAKTTATRWAYPATTGTPIGPVQMTPVVAFGNVYFGTGDNGILPGGSTLYAVSTVDADVNNEGDLLWSRTNGGGTPFSAFRSPSGTAILGSDLNGDPNSVGFANDNFEVFSLNAATGAVLWNTAELPATAASSLGFTYLQTPDATGVIGAGPGFPCVFVPLTNGSYTALYADSGQLNRLSGREALTIRTRGGFLPSLAFGARNPALPNPNDDENAWMYGADGDGYLYAFNYDPDFPDGGQAITPGTPPIQVIPDTPNDNLANDLNDIALRGKVAALLPTEYEDLSRKLRSGTLTYAEVTAAINKVTRSAYEYGETLYLIVYDLPAPTFYSPTRNYTIQSQLNARGFSTQIRSFSISQVQGTSPDRNHVALYVWQLNSIGNNSVVPGRVTLDARILSQDRPGANRVIPGSNTNPNGGTIYLANPLALGTVATPTGTLGGADHIGFSLSPSREDTIGNGNNFNTIGATGDLVAGAYQPLWQGFRPEINGPVDFVSHGQTSANRLFVFDRTLMTFLFGPGRGLTNVRVQAQDLYFNRFGVDSGVINGLDPLLYPGLEDRPGSERNNRSLDYPDIRRDRMRVTKSAFGQVQNPLFQGTMLAPPVYTDAQLTDYRTNEVTFNNAWPRTLRPTNFDFELDVPQYQPANRIGPNSEDGGYWSEQIVFVDSGAGGRQFSSNRPLEGYREASMKASIAPDSRLSVGTPSLDLGAVPSGAGFSPVAPWNDPNFALNSTLFHNASRYPFFTRMSVFNEGNVNLLNVRTAKQEQANSGNLPYLFTGVPTLSPLAALDARWHLHSDLDARFVPNAMPNQRVVFQKARPGDSGPSRLRVNPKRRANPNLNVVDGDFIDASQFPNAQAFQESVQDPKIGVSVPLGAPSGRYLNKVYVFEDLNLDAASAVYPGLRFGTEAYNENDMLLSFNVRETRLTNRQTNKARPMVDDLGNTGTERLLWSNRQPTAARDGQGGLFLAFSSDRLATGNTPGFLARPKTEADTARRPGSYLYIANIGLNTGITPTADFSPMSDLSKFAPVNNNRWFNHLASAYPSNPLSALFNVPIAGIDAESALFRDPAFPSAGTFEMLGLPSSTGRVDRGEMYMAFVGEIDRSTSGGRRQREQRLFISRLDTSGSASIGTPTALVQTDGTSFNPTAVFGKPSLVQSGRNAAVFYTLGTGSDGQLVFSFFNGSNWANLGRGFRNSVIGTLETGNAFESIASPSATLRQSTASPSGAFIEVAFTGRLRGRNQAEVYLSRVAAQNGGPNGGLPLSGGGGYARTFDRRVDQLVQDPSTRLYWSQGAAWSGNLNGVNGGPITDPFSQGFVDVLQLVVNGGTVQYQSVLDHSTRDQASGTNVVSYDCTLGGKVYIDLESGSVRFAGATIPRQARLFARYEPRFLRIAGRAGVNYRTASMVFDDRFIDSDSYWLSIRNTALGTGSNARNDRFVVSMTRTSSEVTGQTRPSVATLRFGVQLPTAVFTNPDGTVPTLTVGSPGGPYQVEPSTGKLYFQSNMQGQTVTVSYRGVDQTGRDLGRISATLRVDYIPELSEVSLDLDEVASESGMTLALDPLGSGFNSQAANARRPNLIWMFWTSTRGGGTDVYFQTVSPQWSSIR